MVEFSQKESRAKDSVNARFDTKKEGKATLFPLFFIPYKISFSVQPSN